MTKLNSSPVRTLCIIQQGERVLLGLKKRGFGAGRWNGFGGKVEPGETLLQATIREVYEEAQVTVTDPQARGILYFTFKNGLSPLEVHIYRATSFSGEPQETDEMRPQWFTAGTIPYSQMWADDPYWLPLLLGGKQFVGTFPFADTEELLGHKLKEVAQLPRSWHG
jgi:8-oxo-dGTP diphosphatase/2-hydroxy-dATP diphosphatase